MEGKLILSSDFNDWNVASNFIAERNLSQNEGFEFGYSFGTSRMLGKGQAAATCRLCRDKFSAGVEVYGGLGSNRNFGFHETAHYAAPAVSWQVSTNSAIHVSLGVGLTHNSNPLLVRLGYSYDIDSFGRKLMGFFGK